MRTRGRTLAGFGLAAGLVIAGIVGVTSMTASGTDGDLKVPYGTLTIDLSNRAGTVTLDRFSDGATFTQPLTTTQPCATVVTSGDLLSFTPNGGEAGYSVQLPSDALGVHQGTNCGGPAGLIGPGERLEIALGSLADFVDDGVTVGSASLAIGKTHPQDGSLQLAFDDGPFGRSISIGNSGGTIAITDTSFTRVTLRSTATQSSRGLSLKGGTVFDLVAPSEFEEAVICSGDPVVVTTGGTAADSATFTRAENGDTKDDVECDHIGVTVQILDDEFVFWDNGNTGLNTGEAQDVRALVEIAWAGVPAAEANDLTTEINYDGDTAGPFFEAQWCESFSQEIVDGELILTAELPTGPIGTSDGTPAGDPIVGTVPWCLVSSSDVLDADGLVRRTTVFYGAGDPVGRWS